MARKRLIAGVAAVLLAPSFAFAQTCPAGMSKADIGTRYLVTEFMVAALSCRNDAGFRESYGAFVKRYNAGLVGNAQAMKAHFGAGAALDSFVTRLANHVALRQNDGPYCTHARARIDRALNASKTATLAQVIDTLGYAQGGAACDDNTPIAALASKETIGAGKVQPAAAKPAEKAAAIQPAAQMAPAGPPAPVAKPEAKAEDTGAETTIPLPAAGGGSELSPTP
jgi:hypothetical protein